MSRVDNKGFTIIELMLAMSFISFLLIGIALIVIQVGALYSKGMMLKEVNQTGRDISNDLRRTIASKDEIDVDTDYREVVSGSTRVGGRLCLGSVSYVWNYGAAIENNHTDLIRYNSASGDKVRIAKITDPTKKYCTPGGGGGLLKVIPAAERNLSSDLLKESDRSLSIYQLRIIDDDLAFDPATGQRLYTIQYTLGSGKSSALNSTQTLCKGPGEVDADVQYCTVEQFSLVVRAGNRVN